MILEILTIISGSIFGVITGIAPGMHINLLAILILNMNFDSKITALLILSIGIAQNFSEAIQTTIFNTPTPETALMPAQQMLKEGKGYCAIQKFVIGALFGTLIAIMISPILYFATKMIYDTLKEFTKLLLAAIIAILILKEKTAQKKIWAFIVAILAGIFGIIVLNSATKQPLFLMLSSLFGTSNLLNSLINRIKIPEQKITEEKNSFTKTTIASLGGVFSLLITSILPGIGGTQAAMLPSKILRIKNESYTALIGSIGTADFIISIITLATIHKARNGAVAIISTIIKPTTSNIITLFSAGLIIAGIATITTIILSKKIIQITNKIDYQKLPAIMMILLFIIGLIFSGINGPAIMITGTAIGILTLTKGLHRSNLMTCLIIPIILN